MIGTIGSLVQETSRRRWLLAVGMYTLACIAAALLLGAALGLTGHLIGVAAGALGVRVFVPIWPHAALVAVGVLALLYAASDLGWVVLPRPHLRDAVPITWWRRARPYGASLAYGAALGFGFMTRVPFGAFYVLCAAVLMRGDPLAGMLVLGAYGAARALVMLPASWGVSRHHAHLVDWLDGPLFDVDRAQLWLAGALFAFAAALLVAVMLSGGPFH
ncbi:MAG TPA: hypothetical protein VF120_16125 [Ktedonobacterales bacterium]